MQQDIKIQNERKIGFPGCKNFVPYYTNTSWDDEKNGFYFYSLPPGKHVPAVYFYHVGTDCSEKICDLTLLNSDNDIRYLPISVFLLKRELLIFIAGDYIAVADLKTGKQERKIYLGEKRNQHGLCISPDERLLCYGISGDGHKPTEVHIVDTLLPGWVNVKTIPLDTHASHFQFFPNGEDILFAHEGRTTEIPDRLNLLNWKTGKFRCLHQHYRDEKGNQIECIGHEHIAGDKVLAVRYPDSQMEFGIIVVDPETGKCELVDQGDYWHSASNKNGTRFTMDTMWWANSRRKIPNLIDITLFDAVKKKKYVLKTIESEPLNIQMYHAHPHMNGAGNTVLYTVHPVGSDESHLELLLLK